MRLNIIKIIVNLHNKITRYKKMCLLKAFSLVELVIVIAIIGILATIATTHSSNVVTQASDTALKTKAISVYNALQECRAINKRAYVESGGRDGVPDGGGDNGSVYTVEGNPEFWLPSWRIENKNYDEDKCPVVAQNPDGSYKKDIPLKYALESIGITDNKEQRKFAVGWWYKEPEKDYTISKIFVFVKKGDGKCISYPHNEKYESRGDFGGQGYSNEGKVGMEVSSNRSTSGGAGYVYTVPAE